MPSNSPAEPQASSSSGTQTAGVPVMNAGGPFEIEPKGSGTVNDPSVSDNDKPPGAADLDLFLG